MSATLTCTLCEQPRGEAGGDNNDSGSRNPTRLVRTAKQPHHGSGASFVVDDVCSGCFAGEAYAIVSHVWGDEVTEYDPKDLGVSGVTWRLPLSSSRKLEKINAALANRGVDHYWIDVLCIPQDDIKAREAEVPRMGQYYKSATTCFVFLENCPATASDVLSLLPFVDDKELGFKSDYVMEVATKYATQCKNVEQIFAYGAGQSWFHRVWTYQECCRPTSVVFLFPDESTCTSDELYKVAEAMLRSGHCLGGIVQRGNIFWGSRALHQRGKPTTEVADVMWNLRFRGCRYPQDKIYGALSLIELSAPLTVSYSKDNYEILLDVLTRSSRLSCAGILRSYWNRDINSGGGDRRLPSWCAPFGSADGLVFPMDDFRYFGGAHIGDDMVMSLQGLLFEQCEVLPLPSRMAPSARYSVVKGHTTAAKEPLGGIASTPNGLKCKWMTYQIVDERYLDPATWKLSLLLQSYGEFTPGEKEFNGTLCAFDGEKTIRLGLCEQIDFVDTTYDAVLKMPISTVLIH